MLAEISQSSEESKGFVSKSQTEEITKLSFLSNLGKLGHGTSIKMNNLRIFGQNTIPISIS